MKTLFGRIRTRTAGRATPLAPPGERTGEGTDSLQPYLEQTRSSRPGPLE